MVCERSQAAAERLPAVSHFMVASVPQKHGACSGKTSERCGGDLERGVVNY